MNSNLIQGIKLSLITMFFWALHDVAFRYAAVSFKVEPTIFICLTMFVSAIVLVLMGGAGKGGLSTLKRGHTWAFGVIEIIMNIAQMFALIYITTTEMNFLNRTTILMSIIGAWIFFSRSPKKSDLLGMALVACGLYYIASNLEESIRVQALICIFFVALSSTAAAMIGEKHPDSNNAHTIKDRCRVTGYVLLVCSFFFLALTFISALIKSNMAGVPLPIIAGLPNLEDFLHKPTFFMAVILGITIMPTAMYFFFYATRVAKTETFMFVSSFLPFLTYAVEWLASKLNMLDIREVSMSDLIAGSIIVLGAILIQVMRMERKSKEKSVPHTSTTASSADFDMVCSALRFYDGDMLKTAKSLGISIEELEAVYEGKGRISFKAEGETYKILLRNYQKNIATADKLTGLAGRDALLTSLETEMQKGIESTVIFLDLNKFKPVNDTYGHEAGDSLLKQVATRLEDATPANALVSRLGGDEFVIMLKNAHINDAQNIVTILKNELEKPFELDGISDDVFIGASFGIATSKEFKTAAEVIKAADHAMYEEKQNAPSRETFELDGDLER